MVCSSEWVAECLRYPSNRPPGARWRVSLSSPLLARGTLRTAATAAATVAVGRYHVLGHSRTRDEWGLRQAVAETRAAAPRHRTLTSSELGIIRSSSSVRRTNSFSCSTRRRFRLGGPDDDQSIGSTGNRDHCCPAG